MLLSLSVSLSLPLSFSLSFYLFFYLSFYLFLSSISFPLSLALFLSLPLYFSISLSNSFSNFFLSFSLLILFIYPLSPPPPPLFSLPEHFPLNNLSVCLISVRPTCMAQKIILGNKTSLHNSFCTGVPSVELMSLGCLVLLGPL